MTAMADVHVAADIVEVGDLVRPVVVDSVSDPLARLRLTLASVPEAAAAHRCAWPNNSGRCAPA